MGIPIVLGLCEDGLMRDLTFLKEFAGDRVSLRLTPFQLGGLTDGGIRILERLLQGLRDSSQAASAILIHHDADQFDVASLRERVSEAYQASLLARWRLPLILCLPRPCTETWLCLCSSPVRKAKRASPKKACDPWKRVWEKGGGNDLDRVKGVAAAARPRLRGHNDFDLFYADWRRAGFP